jgi:outer membrane scaffolding protein for murein synthesis (MipA/OmpV family)
MRIYILHGLAGTELYFRAALRGIISVDMDHFGLSSHGLRGDIKLQLTGYRPAPDSPWRFGGSLGIDIDGAQYNGYFYDVKDSEAIEGRPAYKSHGGYGGVFVSAFVSRLLGRETTWGMFARWDNLDGTAFEDSPLALNKNNVVLGTAITWTFAESKEVVKKSP